MSGRRPSVVSSERLCETWCWLGVTHPSCSLQRKQTGSDQASWKKQIRPGSSHLRVNLQAILITGLMVKSHVLIVIYLLTSTCLTHVKVINKVLIRFENYEELMTLSAVIMKKFNLFSFKAPIHFYFPIIGIRMITFTMKCDVVKRILNAQTHCPICKVTLLFNMMREMISVVCLYFCISLQSFCFSWLKILSLCCFASLRSVSV